MTRPDFRAFFSQQDFSLLASFLNGEDNKFSNSDADYDRYRKAMRSSFRPALITMMMALHADGHIRPQESPPQLRLNLVRKWNEACASPNKKWLGCPWKALATSLENMFMIPAICAAEQSHDLGYEKLIATVNEGNLSNFDTFCSMTGARADLTLRNWQIAIINIAHRQPQSLPLAA